MALNLAFSSFLEYRDKYGFNQTKSDGSWGVTSQNGALFTLEYLIAFSSSLGGHYGTVESEIARIRELFLNIEVLPGITLREPGSTEFDSMDNAVAHLTFSALYDNGAFAKRMLAHGKTVKAVDSDLSQDGVRNEKFYPIVNLLNLFRGPRYYWNNQSPQLFCFTGWFGRSPGFMAYLKLCAGKPLYIGWLWILIGQFIGSFSDTSDTDATKLPYILWQLLKDKNYFWRMAYKLWCWKLMRKYPNGMQDVYARYYDPNHPIVTYSPAYIRSV